VSFRLTLRHIESIHEVAPEAWNACSGENNPFLLHQFFSVLEDSGTACPESGWKPCHLLLSAQPGEQLVAVAPMFLKFHSEGEFVFDYSWADAFERAGGRYYPKLQGAVPYTPVTGPRYLIRSDQPEPEQLRQLLAQAQLDLCRDLGFSSVHLTFCSRHEYEQGQLDPRWLGRLGIQFHFENPGYSDFGDFLARLSARKRKAIRKERQAAQASGLICEALQGPAIEPEHVDHLFRCYRDTTGRKWGRAALTRRFFELLVERMGERVVLMVARRERQLVAAALNLRGHEALYGRNWGCLEEVPFLHFELCYYQAIEFAIAHRLARVEAGAQGFHKVARGYLPRLTYSLHRIEQPEFRALLQRVLDEERQEVLAQLQQFGEEHSPYRREG
jgi:predicted N-acyltransferase